MDLSGVLIVYHNISERAFQPFGALKKIGIMNSKLFVLAGFQSLLKPSAFSADFPVCRSLLKIAPRPASHIHLLRTCPDTVLDVSLQLTKRLQPLCERERESAPFLIMTGHVPYCALHLSAGSPCACRRCVHLKRVRHTGRTRILDHE